MNFFRAFIGIGVTIVLAVFLGWSRNCKHPVAHCYSGLFAIAVLLILRWFL